MKGKGSLISRKTTSHDAVRSVQHLRLGEKIDAMRCISTSARLATVIASHVG